MRESGIVSEQVGVPRGPQHSDGIVVRKVRLKGNVVHPPPSGGDEPFHLPGFLSQGTQSTPLEPAPACLSATKVGEAIPQLATKIQWDWFPAPIAVGVVYPGTAQYSMDAVHVMFGLSKVDGSVGTILTATGLSDHQFGLNGLLSTALIDHVQLSQPPKQLLSHPPSLHRATEAIGGDVNNEKHNEAGNDERIAVLVLYGDGGTSCQQEHGEGDKYVGPHPPEQAGGELARQQVASSVGLQDAETGQTAAIGPRCGRLVRRILGTFVRRTVLEE